MHLNKGEMLQTKIFVLINFQTKLNPCGARWMVYLKFYINSFEMANQKKHTASSVILNFSRIDENVV